MATYSKLPSGTWRVQVRRKGRYISETFLKRDDARRWATEAEGRIDRGEVPTPSRSARLRMFGELIDLHIADIKSVGKAPKPDAHAQDAGNDRRGRPGRPVDRAAKPLHPDPREGGALRRRAHRLTVQNGNRPRTSPPAKLRSGGRKLNLNDHSYRLHPRLINNRSTMLLDDRLKSALGNHSL